MDGMTMSERAPSGAAYWRVIVARVLQPSLFVQPRVSFWNDVDFIVGSVAKHDDG